MRVAVYARVSTHDQQTLGMQVEAMSAYVKDRGWNAVKQVKDISPAVKDGGNRFLHVVPELGLQVVEIRLEDFPAPCLERIRLALDVEPAEPCAASGPEQEIDEGTAHRVDGPGVPVIPVRSQ